MVPGHPGVALEGAGVPAPQAVGPAGVAGDGDVFDIEAGAGRADERAGAAFEALVSDVFPDLVRDEAGGDAVDDPGDPGLVLGGLGVEAGDGGVDDAGLAGGRVRAGLFQAELLRQGLAFFAPGLEEVVLPVLGQADVVALAGRRAAVGADAEALGEGADAGIGDDEHLLPMVAVDVVDILLAEEEPVEAQEPVEVAGPQPEERLGPDEVVTVDGGLPALPVVGEGQDALGLREDGALGRVVGDGGVQPDVGRVRGLVEQRLAGHVPEDGPVELVFLRKGGDHLPGLFFRKDIHGHTFSIRTGMTESSPGATAAPGGSRKPETISPMK